MYRRPDQGWVEVICGPMFSGKSEELIRRITRYQIARLPVQTFKPAIDDRYGLTMVVSHSSLSVDAEPVGSSEELVRKVEARTRVVGVDEGQFFDDELVEAVEHLARLGKHIIVAGLDLDYLARPFGPIPRLMTRAEYVSKMLAVCHRCGGPGMFTQRVIESEDLVVLGATDAYEARCRLCYHPEQPPQPHLDLGTASVPS
jgi:thymidine kinase